MPENTKSCSQAILRRPSQDRHSISFFAFLKRQRAHYAPEARRSSLTYSALTYSALKYSIIITDVDGAV